MLLHEAIAEILRRNGNWPMSVEDIAVDVNRLALCRRKAAQPVPRRHVVARMK